MKRLISTVLIAALMAGTAASAQPRPNDGRPGPGQTQNDRNDNNRGDNNRYDNNRNDNNRQIVRGRPHWSRGDRLPAEYRGTRNSHRVSDYRAHRLRRPPRGYQWVQDNNNDFLMVAITTGLIAAIIANQR